MAPIEFRICCQDIPTNQRCASHNRPVLNEAQGCEGFTKPNTKEKTHKADQWWSQNLYKFLGVFLLEKKSQGSLREKFNLSGKLDDNLSWQYSDAAGTT